VRRVGLLIEAIAGTDAQINQASHFVVGKTNKIADHVRNKIVLSCTLESKGQQL
jgi:hypothetical protein